MRFASREESFLLQIEVGVSFTPGDGPMFRLRRPIGRRSAFEAHPNGDDMNGVLVERCGYVNRSSPDNEMDRSVDDLARRLVTFDEPTLVDSIWIAVDSA